MNAHTSPNAVAPSGLLASVAKRVDKCIEIAATAVSISALVDMF